MPSGEFFAGRTGLLMDEHRFKSEVPYSLLPSGTPSFDHGMKVPYGCQFGFQHRENLTTTIPTIDCDNGHWYGGKECTGNWNLLNLLCIILMSCVIYLYLHWALNINFS